MIEIDKRDTYTFDSAYRLDMSFGVFRWRYRNHPNSPYWMDVELTVRGIGRNNMFNDLLTKYDDQEFIGYFNEGHCICKDMSGNSKRYCFRFFFMDNPDRLGQIESARRLAAEYDRHDGYNAEVWDAYNIIHNVPTVGTPLFIDMMYEYNHEGYISFARKYDEIRNKFLDLVLYCSASESR